MTALSSGMPVCHCIEMYFYIFHRVLFASSQLTFVLKYTVWVCTRSFLALSCLYDGNPTHFLIGNVRCLDTLWCWPWKNNVVHARLYPSLILFLSASFQSRFSLTFKLLQGAINARQTVKPVNDVSLFTGNQIRLNSCYRGGAHCTVLMGKS